MLRRMSNDSASFPDLKPCECEFCENIRRNQRAQQRARAELAAELLQRVTKADPEFTREYYGPASIPAIRRWFGIDPGSEVRRDPRLKMSFMGPAMETVGDGVARLEPIVDALIEALRRSAMVFDGAHGPRSQPCTVERQYGPFDDPDLLCVTRLVDYGLVNGRVETRREGRAVALHTYFNGHGNNDPADEARRSKS